MLAKFLWCFSCVLYVVRTHHWQQTLLCYFYEVICAHLTKLACKSCEKNLSIFAHCFKKLFQSLDNMLSVLEVINGRLSHLCLNHPVNWFQDYSQILQGHQQPSSWQPFECSSPIHIHVSQALINVIRDCQEMHIVITQLFLLTAPILQPGPPLMPFLFAYLHDSHSTVGSMLKSTKTLQHQVAALQKALHDASHALDEDCKPSPTPLPSSSANSLNGASHAQEIPPWKGTTPPKDPTETQTYGKMAILHQVPCNLFMGVHPPNFYTHWKLGEAKKKEGCIMTLSSYVPIMPLRQTSILPRSQRNLNPICSFQS